MKKIPLYGKALIVTFLAAACVVVVIGIIKRAPPAESDETAFDDSHLRPLPPIPAELKPAILALRRGDRSQTNSLIWDHMKPLEAWLSGVLIKGETTADDVAALLGPNLEDLDRPQRDFYITKQVSVPEDAVSKHYFLGDTAAFTTLVFDFDPKTGKLVEWATGQGVCGFCPHVYADDGRWRLEGKLLAGCIGVEQEATDTLLLPRAAERGGRVDIKVANVAPEVEFIDQVQLGRVPLAESEELDVGHDGIPYAWQPERELAPRFETISYGRGFYNFDLGRHATNDVVVLEVRNTSTFENEMRRFVLQGGKEPEATEIDIQFDVGSDVHVRPVGTKLLRRVVVPAPAGAERLRLSLRPELWHVPRIWIGKGHAASAQTEWQTPTIAIGPVSNASTLISTLDQQRLSLAPMQAVELCFPARTRDALVGRVGYVVRMTGYYTFEREVGHESK